MEIYTDDEGGSITQTFKKEQVLSVERGKLNIDIDLSGQGEGLRSLLGTLPQNWRERWHVVTEESSAAGMIFLYVVTAAWFIFIPALLIHAGSAIVGVADPSYSRAVMCVVLVLVFTIIFAWATNRIGWLVDLSAFDIKMLILGPLYLAGQTVVYKWSYVTDWQKAIPLVCIGLLVTLITAAAFLVLLSILA